MEDLERLVAEHYGAVLRRITVVVRDPAAADDLAQETILSYLKARERGTDVKDPAAFLYGTARLLVLEYLRKQRRSARLLADLVAQDWPLTSTDENAGESADELDRLLRELSPVERTIVLGRHHYELPLRVIASQLNLPLVTVHHKYGQAMERLRRLSRSRAR